MNGYVIGAFAALIAEVVVGLVWVEWRVRRYNRQLRAESTARWHADVERMAQRSPGVRAALAAYDRAVAEGRA